MRAITFIFVVVLIGLFDSFAQENLTHFNRKDGLSSTWVRACVEDANGNLWFATDKGLCKFNGEIIEEFTKKEGLPAKQVKQLFIDKNDKLWFTMEPENNLSGSLGGAGGVIIGSLTKKGKAWGRFDNGQFVTRMNKNNSEYLWNHIGLVNGEIWIAGIVRKSKKGFISINPIDEATLPLTNLSGLELPPIGFFYATNENNVWLSSMIAKEDYLYHYDGNQWRAYGENDGLATKVRYKSIKNIINDSSGRTWFVSSIDPLNGGLMHFDGENWTVWTEENGVIGKAINDIVEDNDGNIWVGTNKGLNMFNGTSWVNYSDSDILPHKFVTDIHVDNNGRVWVGTAGGLLLYSDGNWSTFTKGDEITFNGIRSIGEDSYGNIWIGNGPMLSLKKGSVSIFDGTIWKKLASEELPASGYYQDSKGTMWLLTLGNGLFKYDYENNQTSKDLQ